MTGLPALAGLARSLAVYYGPPWKTRAQRRLYAGLVRPGDLVFDVGAHVGTRTRILHGLGCPVVALEPQPLFHRFLARTRPRERIRLRAEAVAAAPGTLTLRVSSRHPTVSTLSSDWIDKVGATTGFAAVAWDAAVSVPVTTLDALITEHGRPAFAKIDVEGMEAAILDGLTRPLPLVSVEYLPAALPEAFACIDRLCALGDARFNRVEGEGARFLHDAWLDGDAMKAVLAALPPGARSGDLYARTPV